MEQLKTDSEPFLRGKVMITRDTMDKIQELKERRYSQEKVAKKLNISRSTVRRYWKGEKGTAADKPLLDRLGLGYFFALKECPHCHTIYPAPKFSPIFSCPGCNKKASWPRCYYGKSTDIPK